MEEMINALKDNKIVVIVRGVAKEKLVPLAEALYKGGIRFIEITYSANGSTPDRETAENIRMLCDAVGDRMYIGAGTVLTPQQVELTKNAGGCFIVSPDVSVDVIEKTCELGMMSLPGALTPTEIQTAHKAGAHFIKLFPITSMGAEYIKSVMAPLSHIDFLAVGGIDLTNMNEYLDTGITGFGIGTNIANKELLSNNDYEGLESLAREYVSIAKSGK